MRPAPWWCGTARRRCAWSPREIKHTVPLGTRYNSAPSSTVQVFLTHQPQERVRALLLAGTLTHHSTADAAVDAYLGELAEVREAGVAVNYGRTSVDEVGVAAPVFDHRGELVSAVVIAAPRYRVTEDQVALMVAACTDAAARPRSPGRLRSRAPAEAAPQDPGRLSDARTGIRRHRGMAR